MIPLDLWAEPRGKVAGVRFDGGKEPYYRGGCFAADVILTRITKSSEYHCRRTWRKTLYKQKITGLISNTVYMRHVRWRGVVMDAASGPKAPQVGLESKCRTERKWRLDLNFVTLDLTVSSRN